MDCLFCKIIKGEIPSTKLYEDELVYAFRDIDPQAPTHFLIVPKEHISSADDLDENHKELIGHIFLVASKQLQRRRRSNCRSPSLPCTWRKKFKLATRLIKIFTKAGINVLAFFIRSFKLKILKIFCNYFICKKL